MSAEAGEAHEAVARQIVGNGEAWRDVSIAFECSRPKLFVTCARGSSDHAATYLKYLAEIHLGILTASFAPSVGSVYGRVPAVAGGVCIAISQSGRSADLLAAVEGFRRAGVPTIAMVNDAESPLANTAQFTILLCAGTERSVAATKSYIASLFACLQLVATLNPDVVPQQALQAVPELLRQAWALEWTALVDRLVSARGLYVIGRGPGLAIAAEAALKLKETCGLQAEAFSAAEVQHGPMALFNEDFPILVFRQDDESAEGIDEFVRMAASRGCPLFVAGSSLGGSGPVGAALLETVKAPAVVQPLLQIQTFYRAANDLALRRGYNPDNPPFLRKVTVTL